MGSWARNAAAGSRVPVLVPVRALALVLLLLAAVVAVSLYAWRLSGRRWRATRRISGGRKVLVLNLFERR